MTDRPLPKPTGSFSEIKRVFRMMAHRRRETQPEINQTASDSVPGAGSGDQ
jgi:hypothetical protein